MPKIIFNIYFGFFKVDYGEKYYFFVTNFAYDLCVRFP